MFKYDISAVGQRIQELAIYLNTNTLWLQHQNTNLDTDLKYLLQLSPIEQLDYVQTTVKFIVENWPEDNDENYYKYQHALQKLEGEIRNHIKIEQQLKLYVEQTQQKIEDCEKLKAEMVQSNKVLVNQLKDKNLKLKDQLKTIYQKFDLNKFRLIQKELIDCKKELNTKNNLINDLTNKFQRIKSQKSQCSIQKENVTGNSFQDYYKNKLKDKKTNISLNEKKIRKSQIQGHSKSPLTTSRTDRSHYLRRHDSPLLNSSRSSKKMESRTFSNERYKKLCKLNSPALNSSRR